MATEILELEVRSNLGDLNSELKETNDLVSGVNKSLGGAQKAMEAVGASSEITSKSLEKIQVGVDFTEGIKSLTGLSKIIKANTIVQRIWNLAMSANPIGLLIAVITSLIAGITALIFWMKKNSEQTKINTALTEKNTEALKSQSKALDTNAAAFDRKQKQQLAMAKATGESVEAIRELEIKLIDEKIAFIASEAGIIRQTLAKQKNVLATLESRDAEQDLIDQQTKNVDLAEANLNKITKAQENALTEELNLLNKHIVQKAEAQTQAQTDARDKLIEDEKERNKILQASQDEEKRRIQELIDLEADRIQKLTMDGNALLDEFNNSQLEAQDKEKNAIYDKYFAIIEGKRALGESVAELEENQQAEILAIKEKYEGLSKTSSDKSVEEQKDLDTQVKNVKQDNAKAGLQILEKVAGEGTEVAKAAAIAQATISGVQSVQNTFATASLSPLMVPIPAYNFIQAGIAGAFSAIQIAKIASGGKPGGSSGGGGGGSAAPAAPAPQMMSGAFDISGGTAPEPVKAFVITDEMTNSQNQLSNIRRRATI